MQGSVRCHGILMWNSDCALICASGIICWKDTADIRKGLKWRMFLQQAFGTHLGAARGCPWGRGWCWGCSCGLHDQQGYLQQGGYSLLPNFETLLQWGRVQEVFRWVIFCIFTCTPTTSKDIANHYRPPWQRFFEIWVTNDFKCRLLVYRVLVSCLIVH